MADRRSQLLSRRLQLGRFGRCTVGAVLGVVGCLFLSWCLALALARAVQKEGEEGPAFGEAAVVVEALRTSAPEGDKHHYCTMDVLEVRKNTADAPIARSVYVGFSGAEWSMPYGVSVVGLSDVWTDAEGTITGGMVATTPSCAAIHGLDSHPWWAIVVLSWRGIGTALFAGALCYWLCFYLGARPPSLVPRRGHALLVACLSAAPVGLVLWCLRALDSWSEEWPRWVFPEALPGSALGFRNTLLLSAGTSSLLVTLAAWRLGATTRAVPKLDRGDVTADDEERGC